MDLNFENFPGFGSKKQTEDNGHEDDGDENETNDDQNHDHGNHGNHGNGSPPADSNLAPFNPQGVYAAALNNSNSNK